MAGVAFGAAAVADYRPVQVATAKIKKDGGSLRLELEPTPDILAEIKARYPGLFCVGFAAETQDMETYARKKVAEKNLDMIAANLIGPPDSGFVSDTNRMTLFFADGSREELDVMDKQAVAHLILDRIVERLG